MNDTMTDNPDQPEKPSSSKIADISTIGIKYYWKKVENATGYEVLRAYKEEGPYESVFESTTNRVGTFVDKDFDRSQKTVFYTVRSYLNLPNQKKVYSETLKPRLASFCEKMTLSRQITYLYSQDSRAASCVYGWGTPLDVKWTTTDPLVATVDDNGTIFGVSAGSCEIVCSSPSLGQSAVMQVVVDRNPPEPLGTYPHRYVRNTDSGIWENPSAKANGEAVILMAGDIMCSKTQMVDQAVGTNEWCFDSSFEDAKRVIRHSDFAIANLETLIASSWPYVCDETYINDQYNANGPASFLDAVGSGGFDALVMSNNHCCDGGVKALQQTIEEVDLRQFARTGAYLSDSEQRFLIVDIQGIKVGFLGYTSRDTGYNGKSSQWAKADRDTMLNTFTPDKATRDITDCRNAGAEYVIVYMHWGKKNYRNPTKAQILEAQQVADAGADYIVGSNPHLIQRFSMLTSSSGKEVPCYYSLGNFLASMNQVPGNRVSAMVRIKLKRTEGDKVLLAENGYIPFRTYKQDQGRTWIPLVLTSREQQPASKGSAESFALATQYAGDEIEFVELLPSGAPLTTTKPTTVEEGKTDMHDHLGHIVKNVLSQLFADSSSDLHSTPQLDAKPPIKTYDQLIQEIETLALIIRESSDYAATKQLRRRGNKFEIKEFHVRSVMTHLRMSYDEAYGYILDICESQGISSSEFMSRKPWKTYRDQQVESFREELCEGAAKPLQKRACAKGYKAQARQRVFEDCIRHGIVTIGALAAYLNAEVPDELKGQTEHLLGYIATNPEQLTTGCIYIALKSNASIIAKMEQTRPLFVVCNRKMSEKFTDAGIPTMVVFGVGSYYREIVSIKRNLFPAKIVGITGSVGKTTTKLMVNAVVQNTFRAITYDDNHNIPAQMIRPIRALTPSTEVVVQEISGGAPFAAESSTRMLSPNVFVITKMDDSHAESFNGDPISRLYEKTSIDRYASDDAVGIINWDDDQLKAVPYHHRIMRYSLQKRAADIWAENISAKDGELHFEVVEPNGLRTPCRVRGFANHNVSDALAAFSVGLVLGMDRAEISHALNSYQPAGTRQNLFRVSDVKVFVDCFNATPETIKGMLESLRTITVPPQGRRIAVLGDIFELGNDTERLHRRLGKIAASNDLVDIFCFCGENMRYAFEEAHLPEEQAIYFENKNVLSKWLAKQVRADDLVAFKGSHAMDLARVIDDIFDTDFSLFDYSPDSYKKVERSGTSYRVFESYGAVVMRAQPGMKSFVAEPLVANEPLRTIAAGAFERSSLESVELCEPLRTIGERAFAGSLALSEISLPESLRLINVDAFKNCTSLTKVSIPLGVHSIKDHAFAECHSLEEVVLPASLSLIEEGAFEGCHNAMFIVQANTYADMWTSGRGLKVKRV